MLNLAVGHLHKKKNLVERTRNFVFSIERACENSDFAVASANLALYEKLRIPEEIVEEVKISFFAHRLTHLLGTTRGKGRIISYPKNQLVKVFISDFASVISVGLVIGDHYNFACYLFGAGGQLLVTSGYKNIIIRLFPRP